MDDGGKDTKQAAHRQGDVSGGTASPAIATGGSPNVFINGRPAMREGDAYEDGSTLVEGSKSVFINGKPAGRSLAATSNGGIAFSGSPNVFIGDYEGTGSNAPNDKAQEQSSCQSAQEKVRQETEHIKNSYDHDVKKYGRGFGIFSAPPPTPLGENYLMPSQYREINKAITAAYGKLVEDAPYLPWARVGHVVTAQFGCTIKNMMNLDKWIVSHEKLNEADDAMRAIGEGNIRIFDGLYPTMWLVADQGMNKFLECAKTVISAMPYQKTGKTHRKLQQGKSSEAEKMIIDYEQRGIAPPIYRE